MTTAPTTSSSALDRFFASLRRSPVHRPTGGKIGGVCAGIADRLDVSVKMVRVATVVLVLFGPALAIYLVAWLLLPDAAGSIQLERALRAGQTSSIVLLVATVLVAMPDVGVHSRIAWFSLALVGVVGAMIYRDRSRPHQK